MIKGQKVRNLLTGEDVEVLELGTDGRHTVKPEGRRGPQEVHERHLQEIEPAAPDGGQE